MDRYVAKRALKGAFFVGVGVAAVMTGVSCGGAVNGGPGGAGASTTSTAGAGGMGTTTATAGSGGTVDCPGGCDDGFNCTIDSCVNSACLHTIGSNVGATACPPGKYCQLDAGCIDAPACATTEQCVEKWKDDACKTMVACDPVSSLCTFMALDKDGDGHSPPVCGGDDCDDSDPSRHPGAQELCNSEDEDCDGVADNHDAVCANPAYGCEMSVCVCKPQNLCNGTCVDLESDQKHCGDCATDCGLASCENGACVCNFPYVQCGATCTQLHNDSENCGSCGNACPAETYCAGYECTCFESPKQFCNGVCVDIYSDPMNCGACGITCPQTQDCISGQCKCPFGGQICNGVCVNTAFDPENCGMCGNACGQGSFCMNGTCGSPTCLPQDAPCDANGQCCSTMCGANGLCQCLALGSPCTLGSECCMSICSMATGTCL